MISGVGGLGQLAIEYAKAMGLHVAAVDVTERKLALARASGAEVTVNARLPDAVKQVVRQTGGGTHGALVTAASAPAFRQAIHMVRRKGTVALVGLPPGEFAMPIIEVVLGRITIRGSIVGGRQDLAEAIEFAAEGKVHSHYHEMKLEDINQVFSDMKAGTLDGRMVMTSFEGTRRLAGRHVTQCQGLHDRCVGRGSVGNVTVTRSWVARKKMSPFFAYDANYLIDNKLGIIVDAEGTARQIAAKRPPSPRR